MHPELCASLLACRHIIVHHSGALGDSVLVWPMLRALRRTGASVPLVAPASKAALAASVLGITGVDEDRAEHRALWIEGGGEGITADDGPDAVVSWNAGASHGERVWRSNARIRYPRASTFELPGKPDRFFALKWSEPWAGGAATPVALAPGRPPACHIGAGSNDKRWPLERWIDLARRIGGQLVAGPVEAEQLTKAELADFKRAQGAIVLDLAALHARLASAGMVISADTGPAHLAAQLGLPTLVLFGPTDPARWAPVGPRVAVLAPPKPTPMDWLDVDRVEHEARAMLV